MLLYDFDLMDYSRWQCYCITLTWWTTLGDNANVRLWPDGRLSVTMLLNDADTLDSMDYPLSLCSVWLWLDGLLSVYLGDHATVLLCLDGLLSATMLLYDWLNGLLSVTKLWFDGLLSLTMLLYDFDLMDYSRWQCYSMTLTWWTTLGDNANVRLWPDGLLSVTILMYDSDLMDYSQWLIDWLVF